MKVFSLTGKQQWMTIILTACIAAAMDGFAAVIVNNVTGELVFRYIAAGIFGVDRAFSAGYSMVIIGVVLHLAITFFWTMIYAILEFRFSLRRYNLFLMVVSYGCIIWVCMNLVVVPLSRISQMPTDLREALIGVAVLIGAVSFPIVFLLRRSRVTVKI